MASNWDEDFDFEDQAQPSNKKQSAKAKNNQIEEFSDHQDNKAKLPTINPRGESGKSYAEKSRSSKRFNPYAQKLNSKSNFSIDSFEQQQVPNVKSNSKNIKSNSKNNHSNFKPPSSKNESDVDDFYEQVAEEHQDKSTHLNKDLTLKNGKQENSYGEDFEEDAGYGDDFEEVEDLPNKKKSIVKSPHEVRYSNQPLPLKNTSKHDNQNHSVNTFSKQPSHVNKTPMRRVQSKKSLKSADMKRVTGVSRGKVTSLVIPNKHSNMVDKLFPDFEADKETPQKIVKMNQNIRGMIKRFNDQLNDLINKNMLQMKAKRNQKGESVEDRVRILLQEKKNNESAVQRMDYELGRLQGREGEIKQEQFYIMIEKNIEEVRASLKQTEREISHLKFQVSNSGKKLTRNEEDKKVAQELHHLKVTLIQTKRDDEKEQQKIKKLDERMTQLMKKIPEIQEQLKRRIEEAKSKGILLESRDQIIRRYEQTKKRNQNAKNHKLKLQNLFRAKAEIISHELEQIKINVQNSQLQIKNIHGSIVHSQSESAKIVERTKQKQKISLPLVNTLQEILKSLDHKNEFDPNFEYQSAKKAHKPSMKNAFVNNDHEKHTEKRQSEKNLQKKEITPALPQKQQRNSKKPNFLKNKTQDQLELTDIKNQAYERIWKEEEDPKEEKERQKVHQKEIDAPVENAKEEDKKKPFSLKRNRASDKPTQSKSNDNQSKLELTSNDNKQEQIKESKLSTEINVAPRMMKFRKNKITDTEGMQEKAKTPDQTQQPKSGDQVKKNKQHEQQNEDAQPIFAPKRLNLRNRTNEKKEQYIPPTIEKKEAFDNKEEQYRPNMGFKVDDQYAQAKSRQNIPASINVEAKKEEVSKPSFNLRLRDRNKNVQNREALEGQKIPNPKQSQFSNNDSEKNNPYLPKDTNNPYAPKEEVRNPYAPKEEVKNPYNPYAPQDGVGHQKQGRVKKQKLGGNQPKPKLNIYDQAEDLVGDNQFVNQPPQQSQLHSNIEVSLNDMLGLKKNTRKNQDDDLLTGNDKYTAKKEKNKPDDFFLDL